MKKRNKLSSCLSSVLQSQQYFCFCFYILSLTLSCLTQKACLIGWELLLLVMTCYFFFLPFITSELTRQLSAAARLSTLDPDVPRVQTDVVTAFKLQHLTARGSLVFSLLHHTCLSPFLEGSHQQQGGIWLLCPLAPFLFGWVCQPGSLRRCWCGLEQNWNACFPYGSEQLSDSNECQCPTAGACCVYVFVSCVCTSWIAAVLGSSFLLSANKCPERLP